MDKKILINFITHVFSVGSDHQAVSEPGSIRDRVRVTFLQQRGGHIGGGR